MCALKVNLYKAGSRRKIVEMRFSGILRLKSLRSISVVGYRKNSLTVFRKDSVREGKLKGIPNGQFESGVLEGSS